MMEPQTPFARLTPLVVMQRIVQGDPVVLVDVRTPAEYAAHHIAGVRLIPIDEFAGRVGELEAVREQEIICVCEHGVRSEMAAQYLAGKGFPRAATMTGGMAAYPGPVEVGA